jgi:protein AaeX
VKATWESDPMLREVAILGAFVPSLLLYFLVAIPLFLAFDKLTSHLGFYRFVWHPALARFALFVCLLSGLVLLSGP